MPTKTEGRSERSATWADAGPSSIIHQNHTVLRVVSCGSVDDGKSTLLGRLLYECGAVPDDELANVRRDSEKAGAVGNLDFSLLVDGLQSERQQGITIDVAFRYFSTARRSFILADSPGHEQYTRNMATAASTADLAILLVDARKGLLTQTRRHAIILSELGVRHVVVAINKMDLIGYAEESYESIATAFRAFADKLNFETTIFIPVVARDGDNIVESSSKMQWYSGVPLLRYLEMANPFSQSSPRAFRMPIQRVNRPNSDFRGFSGTILSGSIRVGDRIIACPSGQEADIARIVTYEGDLQEMSEGATPTLVLSKEIDLSRGDILADPERRPIVADQFRATLIWMSEENLIPHRPYQIRCGMQWSQAEVTAIKHKIGIEDLSHLSATSLTLNDFGVCNISCRAPLVFDPYRENRRMGSFILVHPVTGQTVAAGLIDFELRRATNIHWQAIDVSKSLRAELKAQTSSCIWLTGLSGSGKSTIANQLERKLYSLGYHTYILDGDNLRHGLCRDLGFTEEDRVENIRRAAHTARLMVDAGLIVIASFISPFKADRDMARALFDDGEFVEVFVDTPLEVCEKRDTKGLYRRAREGHIPNFTGVSAPYERPEHPEVTLKEDHLDASLKKLLEYLKKVGLLRS